MAVTATPSVSTVSIAAYRITVGTGRGLTHLSTVGTPPGSVATPSGVAGGSFDLWFDPVANVILDVVITKG